MNHKGTKSTKKTPRGITWQSRLALAVFFVLSLCPLCLCGEPSGEDKVPAIDADILGGIEDRQPVRGADENGYEARAYSYILLQARQYSPEAFARSARRDVTFAHLFEQ